MSISKILIDLCVIRQSVKDKKKNTFASIVYNVFAVKMFW